MPQTITHGAFMFEIHPHFVTIYKFDAFSQEYYIHDQCHLAKAKQRFPDIFEELEHRARKTTQNDLEICDQVKNLSIT